MSRAENFLDRFYPTTTKAVLFVGARLFFVFGVITGGAYLHSKDRTTMSDEQLAGIVSSSKIIFSPSTHHLAFVHPEGNGGQTIQILDSDGKINIVFVTFPGDELVNLHWSDSTIPELIFEFEALLIERGGMQVGTTTISEHKVFNTQTGKLETTNQVTHGERIDSF